MHGITRASLINMARMAEKATSGELSVLVKQAVAPVLDPNDWVWPETNPDGTPFVWQPGDEHNESSYYGKRVHGGAMIKGIDVKKLAEVVKAAGFFINAIDATSLQMHRIRHQRFRVLKSRNPSVKLVDVNVHPDEVLGASGTYVAITKQPITDMTDPESFSVGRKDILAFGRSDTEDGALLQAMFGALREGK